MPDYGVMRFHSLVLMSLVGALVLGPALSLPADSPEVSYDRESNRLSVKATGQPLLEVLEQLAIRTGWHIFIEPNANPEIETEFKEVQVGRALEFLVGGMNYALLPQREGPTQLLVFRTSRDNATLRVHPADGARPTITIRRIGNELIVTVEPGTDIEAIAARLGAKVTGHIPGTGIYRLTFENEAAAKTARTGLAIEPGVKGVDYNYVIDRPAPVESIAQGPGLPGPLKLNPPSGDDKIVIGLIDTGVQQLGSDLDDFFLPGESVAGDSEPPTGQPTHGTSMGLTALNAIRDCSGGSTGIQLLPIDVYGGSDSATSYGIAAGIVEAVNGGADVINMSLGGYGSASYVESIINEASANGTVFVASAGNQPVTTPVYPAAYTNAVAVTATYGDQLAPYANRGSFVDVAAPGSAVVYFGGQPFLIDGTSPAAAYFSGLVACVAEKQGISMQEAAAQVSAQYAVHFSGASSP